MIKVYGNKSLEAIAEGFLSKHGTYDGRALRLEAAIESYGYQIFAVPGLAEVAEAYVPIKQGYIFVDEEQYMNAETFRWRFSLAEELAHILIHRPLFQGMSVDQIIEFQNKLTDDEYLTMEREAKYLAGCLLMPQREYRSRFDQFYAIQSSRVSSELKILRFVVRQLSFDFNASFHSVALRGLKLDLIDQQQFDDLMESVTSGVRGE
ncbi:MAG: ImmA/IrrE family metallo-endopeptidase [Verrucomicrobia bacterium]|nr:ImmA/IrrE family metallo-endopeptidase [Verrucomicrobiota bacterium]